MTRTGLPWRAGTGVDAGGIYSCDGALLGIMLDPLHADLAVETVNGIVDALLRRLDEIP